MIPNPLTRALCIILSVALGMGPLGCRNPAQSSLPPSAVAPPDAPLPPLPKGDLYADETAVSADVLIDAGDTLEVIIHRGVGEEKYTSVVRDSGMAQISFLEVPVKGLTLAQAEVRVQAQAAPYMRDPHVQMMLKKKNLKLKRVFVFGDVKKPGHVPLARNMTLLQAILQADNYNETALLDEIRVIRGGDLSKPNILQADLSRLFTYGDMSRNLSLEENDIVYVPRERVGDVGEFGKKVQPLLMMLMAPFYALFLTPAYFPNAQIQ